MIDVRVATSDDDPAVLELLQASMGWVPDEQYARFFAWKHRESPFGESPAWVAVDGERIVGFRTFLRWQFVHDGRVVDAVRAVDTATHPDYQGKGIFSLLTRHALDELATMGTGFVFNTPNDRSRPGYVKMGWQLVQRLPVAARPRSALALVRLARARTPADKWSADSTGGVSAPEALADREAVAALLDRLAGESGPGLATHRTPDYLAWRYGFPPLHYRALTGPGGLADGMVVFRVRRRGAATEAALCEVLVPGDDSGMIRQLLAEVLRSSQADHAVWLGAARPALGLLPIPGQGPTLMWRSVCEQTPPPAADWHLTLGDIELF
ncbi:MAG TPA: GNAT family N-acetyltransferase [Acidimicrobiales bacterium]|nr:GNAT family N-acetyltransferase [Acidimicrobiales bacterium]